MNCKCGYPFPPLPRIMKEGFLGIKEIPNIEDYACVNCGRKYKLKSYKGEITILKTDKHYGGVGHKDNSNLKDLLPKCPHKIRMPEVKSPKQISKGYIILTKDDYKRYMLSFMKPCDITTKYIKILDENWQIISKGFNFIIGIGQVDDLMFCSVEYFNEKILGGNA